jgi:UDP-glucose 4-epimerase
VFNVGSTEEITISDLAARIAAAAGVDPKIRYVPYTEAYVKGFEDMQRRVPSTDKVNGLLGWVPEKNLDDILSETIAEAVAEAEEAAIGPHAD